MKPHSLLLVGLILSVFTFTASRLASHAHAHAHATQDASWSELMASMASMHSAMISMDPSNDSDTDFVKLMLPHHQGAVDMAKAELVYGKDSQMRRLAQEIITDQESEIELMNLWLNRSTVGSEHRLQGLAESRRKGN
jgi:uncharacterized protein (DUF305 family)